LPDCYFSCRIVTLVAGLLLQLPDCNVVAGLFTLDAGLLARSQYSESPATDHLGTGFSLFPCV